MDLVIELERETDGRWIADVPELNILLYGATQEEAIQKAEDASRLLIADKISRGELPAEASNPKFAVAA
jgi:predicted RNase H-like HicB family nuclease